MEGNLYAFFLKYILFVNSSGTEVTVWSFNLKFKMKIFVSFLMLLPFFIQSYFNFLGRYATLITGKLIKVFLSFYGVLWLLGALNHRTSDFLTCWKRHLVSVNMLVVYDGSSRLTTGQHLEQIIIAMLLIGASLERGVGKWEAVFISSHSSNAALSLALSLSSSRIRHPVFLSLSW